MKLNPARLTKVVGAASFAAFVLVATASQAASSSTPEFIDKLTQCAGGAEISIDANLLGSVRSIYDGDKTVGKAHLKTVAAFLQYIPEKDKLAAMELYNKCVTSLLGNEYDIKSETVDVRFSTYIPADMNVEFNNNNLRSDVLLLKGGFFSHMFDPLLISYRIMNKGCDWGGFDKYNEDTNYYYSHGFSGSLNPSAMGHQSLLSAETFSVSQFFFTGSGWTEDSITSKGTPIHPEPLKSVTQLLGKCIYIQFIPVSRGSKYGDPPELSHWVTSYTKDFFHAIRLDGFSIKFNENYKFDLIHYKQVFANESMKIWEAPLPNNISDYNIR